MKWFLLIPAISAFFVFAGYAACQTIVMNTSAIVFFISWIIVGIFHEEFEK